MRARSAGSARSVWNWRKLARSSASGWVAASPSARLSSMP
jgi:hypothetical protein